MTETLIRRGYNPETELSTTVTDNEKGLITVRRSDGEVERVHYSSKDTLLDAIGCACFIAGKWDRMSKSDLRIHQKYAEIGEKNEPEGK